MRRRRALGLPVEGWVLLPPDEVLGAPWRLAAPRERDGLVLPVLLLSSSPGETLDRLEALAALLAELQGSWERVPGSYNH